MERILGSLVEVVTAPEVTLVSLRIDRGPGCQTRPLLGWQVQFDLLNDVPSDFLLQFENAWLLSLVFSRPNVLIRRGTNQLGVDTDLASFLHKRPFDDRIDREHLGNLGH